jgi:hypothetical protein
MVARLVRAPKPIAVSMGSLCGRSRGPGSIVFVISRPNAFVPADPDDGAGKWYQELHHLGEDMQIRLGRVLAADAIAPGTTVEPEWLEWPHWRYDGVGALGQALRDRGAMPPDERLPAMKTSRPTTAERLRAPIGTCRDLWSRCNGSPSRATPWHRMPSAGAFSTWTLPRRWPNERGRRAAS